MEEQDKQPKGFVVRYLVKGFVAGTVGLSVQQVLQHLPKQDPGSVILFAPGLKIAVSSSTASTTMAWKA